MPLLDPAPSWYFNGRMPAVIPPHAALRNTLRETAGEVIIYSERLEAVIAVKSRTWSSEGYHGKVSHSPAPWNSAAAGAVLDLHSWARETEALMRLRLGFRIRRRGGSTKNTYIALKNITNLAEGIPDEVVRDASRWLSAWCTKASVILGETETAKRLPRVSGRAASACPWCRQDTLRQLAIAGTVFCCDPSCTDEEGRRPKAQLEYFDSEWTLRWQDNILGAP